MATELLDFEPDTAGSEWELSWEDQTDSGERERLQAAADEDGDKIKDPVFLAELGRLTQEDRLRVLAAAARHLYIAPSDLESYFDAFPDDAEEVYYVASSGMDWENYALRAKALGLVIRRMPGRLEELKEYEEYEGTPPPWLIDMQEGLEVGERSELARAALLENQPGDYKLSAQQRFSAEKYGPVLQKEIIAYIQWLEDSAAGADWGVAWPDQVLKHPAARRLPAERRIELVKDLLSDMHNALVYREVHYGGGSLDKQAPVDHYRSGSRGIHSILYKTPHRPATFSYDTYADLQDMGFRDEYPGGEHDYETTIEATIKSARTIPGLSEEQKEELIGFLLGFWDKNRDPVYGPELAATLSALAPSVAVREIMIRLPEADDLDQTRLLSLLFRLEVGRVGISGSGLEYLTRRFDLGTYNDPENFAYRLTREGQIGVFDRDQKLLGMVQLEAADFAAGQEERIAKEVQSITYEMLFTPHPDETAAERQEREAVVTQFGEKFFSTYLQSFAGRSELRFNDLSLREEGWSQFYLNRTAEDPAAQAAFYAFVNRYGQDGFCAFRSVEFDPEAGEKLLGLEEVLGVERVRETLREYRRTYELADTTAQRICAMLKESDDTLEADLVRENILRRAQGHLTDGQTYDSGEAAGTLGLQMLNHMLSLFNELPTTVEGFIRGQALVDPYLRDRFAWQDQPPPTHVQEGQIAAGLKGLYDKPSFNLREYEGKTNDLANLLSHTLKEMNDPDWRLATGFTGPLRIYDLGAGEGRVGIPLALEGHEVVGIDISPRMVASTAERVNVFTRDVLDKRDTPYLTEISQGLERAGKRLREEGLAGLPERITIKEGNYFDVDREGFKERFGERQAEVAIVAWHTLGFAGTPEGMVKVLSHAFENLAPGGKLLIELPDRNFGGYARALRQYHLEHPDEPFGVLQDAPSADSNSPTTQDASNATSRYFPSIDEMVEVMERAGFNFRDVHTYFVAHDSQAGRKLAIKESLYVAEKPLGPEQYERLLGLVGDDGTLPG